MSQQASAAKPSQEKGAPVTGEETCALALPGSRAVEVLEALTSWGDLVTIVLHGGCVFEFKGPFPGGSVARGHYNLDGELPGFHGHLRLDAINHIGFQDRPHAGRIAHALTFNDHARSNLFKVFLGRDADGDIYPQQMEAYETLRSTATALPLTAMGELPS
jgi:hypothetical protein